jgi:hypothetical protein
MLSIFTNKHLIMAMLVAPILAVIAWFLTDRMVTPEAQIASAGETYELIAKPNCRYQSNKCELVNGDVTLTIEPLQHETTAHPMLKMTSTVPVEILRIEFLDFNDATRDVVRHSNDSGLFEVSGSVTAPLNEIKTMRLGLVSAGVNYFAETNIKFLSMQ